MSVVVRGFMIGGENFLTDEQMNRIMNVVEEVESSISRNVHVVIRKEFDNDIDGNIRKQALREYAIATRDVAGEYIAAVVLIVIRSKDLYILPGRGISLSEDFLNTIARSARYFIKSRMYSEGACKVVLSIERYLKEHCVRDTEGRF